MKEIMMHLSELGSLFIDGDGAPTNVSVTVRQYDRISGHGLVIVHDQGSYDPMDDEAKAFDLDGFTEAACCELRSWADDGRGQNEFNVAKHTWHEWWGSFMRYMSW